ncbi:MAG: ParB N-terminal domain-containing protein, partial [Flammeovirgaceae bacterium]
MNISNLNPNPKNPRKISEEGLKALKTSLEKFGDLSGVVYNRTTKQLVGGHQRVKIFQKENPEIVMTSQIFEELGKIFEEAFESFVKNLQPLEGLLPDSTNSKEIQE